jgi:hypothetical protein
LYRHPSTIPSPIPLRSLSLLAQVFVLSFAPQLLAVLFSFQLLEPAWQWRFSNALINGDKQKW